MAIIQTIASLIILGILYKRMIKREVPTPVSKWQAVVPIILGIISLPLSFLMVLGNGLIMVGMGINASEFPPVAGSVYSAFFVAGLPEEVAKLLIILLCLLIFRSKIQNVYEYMLIGAAVGFGFTLFEEFIYGGEGAAMIARLITIAAHMVFGILMAKHLGLARYYKENSQGSPAKERIFAILLPVVIHTLYDTGTAQNKFLDGSDDDLVIGLVLAAIAMIVMFAVQIIALVRFKKNTEKYCEMCFENDIVENSGNIKVDMPEDRG